MAISATTLVDALKIAANAKNEVKPQNATHSTAGLDRSSIMKASKDLIMSFPVICSDTVTPQTAMMITKAIERNCVTTLELLFSSAYLSGSNGRDIIKNWHTNMDNSWNMDDYMDLRDAGLNSLPSSESATLSDIDKVSIVSEQLNVGIAKYHSQQINLIESTARRMQNTIMTEKLKFYDPSFSDESILEFKSVYNDADGSRTIIQEFSNDDDDKHNSHAAVDKSLTDFQTKQLLDSDVKKCNELVPSLIIVRYIAAANDATTANNAIEKQFIAGVKARLVPCSSEDIVSHLRSAVKNKVSLLNFIRATTSEISFAKDFIFAIDQAKIDAKNNSSRISKTSPIWRSLQNRSTASGLSRLRKNRNNIAGAITTLAITREEVNILKKEFNIDLDNPKTAMQIMNAYNLMCLVIIDEDIEVAKFLMDGEAYYTDFSFSSLERETGDGSYKKIINLISRVNRG